MAVDVVRSCYSRPCRFYPGQRVPTRIVWYFADPAALNLDLSTCFWSFLGQKDQVNVDGCGELTDTPHRWRDGSMPHPGLVGDHYEGTERDFLGLGLPPGSVMHEGGALPTTAPCMGSFAEGELAGQVHFWLDRRAVEGEAAGQVQFWTAHAGVEGELGRAVALAVHAGVEGELGQAVELVLQAGVEGTAAAALVVHLAGGVEGEAAAVYTVDAVLGGVEGGAAACIIVLQSDATEGEAAGRLQPRVHTAAEAELGLDLLPRFEPAAEGEISAVYTPQVLGAVEGEQGGIPPCPANPANITVVLVGPRVLHLHRQLRATCFPGLAVDDLEQIPLVFDDVRGYWVYPWPLDFGPPGAFHVALRYLGLTRWRFGLPPFFTVRDDIFATALPLVFPAFAVVVDDWPEFPPCRLGIQRYGGAEGELAG